MHHHVFVPLALVSVCLVACSEFPSEPPASEGRSGRVAKAADVGLPSGYLIEAIATGLTFPSGVVTDERGRVYVTEAGYSCGEVWGEARLLRVDQDGSLTAVAAGGHPPWNGVDYADGAFFISEGGELGGGRILRLEFVEERPRWVVLADNLPSLGDHHTNGPIVSQDGFVYFGQGSATNSGIVGLDNLQTGWLERHPDFHDVPGQNITLAGVNFTAPNVLDPSEREPLVTGAFVPLGSPTAKGQVVKGRLPCTGAVLRVPICGGPLELVAWGLRDPAGLAFSPDARLFVTENGCEARGGRPIGASPDVLWHITRGAWYGWPDYQAGEPVFNPEHRAPGHAAPQKLLAVDPGTPPRPAARLGMHSASSGIAFSRNPLFGFAGQAFIAQFGDMAPAFGKVLAPWGFKVVRVDVGTGQVRDFAVNLGGSRDGQSGPASRLNTCGLERPVALRFSRDGTALYIVDFGVVDVTRSGVQPVPGSGVLWRITRAPEADSLGAALSRVR